MVDTHEHNEDISGLLAAWKGGDDDAWNSLVPIIYDELRRRASTYLRRERQNHTLQTTALVHEAYLKLAGQREANWENRSQFYIVASEMMRRVLVDHARGRKRDKRGGEIDFVPLHSDFQIAINNAEINMVELDEALTALAAIDPFQAKVVELRYFGGCRIDETAEILETSVATVNREWATAKAWLRRKLSPP